VAEIELLETSQGISEPQRGVDLHFSQVERDGGPSASDGEHHDTRKVDQRALDGAEEMCPEVHRRAQRLAVVGASQLDGLVVSRPHAGGLSAGPRAFACAVHKQDSSPRAGTLDRTCDREGERSASIPRTETRSTCGAAREPLAPSTRSNFRKTSASLAASWSSPAPVDNDRTKARSTQGGGRGGRMSTEGGTRMMGVIEHPKRRRSPPAMAIRYACLEAYRSANGGYAPHPGH
jgi:hypothetical protein